MSADKFKQLSDAFLKISQGFAEVASVMSSDLEPVALLKRPVEIEEAQSSESLNCQIELSAAAPVAKKIKKEKDPNAPKRPLNAYFLFQRDFRLHLKSTQPDLPSSEYAKSINEAWEKMSPTERSKYENEAKALLEAFNKENKAYKESKDGGFEVASTSIEEKVAESVASVPASASTATVTVIPAEAALPIVSPSSEVLDTPKKKKKKEKHREGSQQSQQQSP